MDTDILERFEVVSQVFTTVRNLAYRQRKEILTYDSDLKPTPVSSLRLLFIGKIYGRSLVSTRRRAN